MAFLCSFLSQKIAGPKSVRGVRGVRDAFCLKLNPHMMSTEPSIYWLTWGDRSVWSWASLATFRAALMLDFLLLPRILALGYTHIVILHFLYWTKKKPKPKPSQWIRSPVDFQWPIFTFSLPASVLWTGLCLTALGCLQSVMCNLCRREGSPLLVSHTTMWNVNDFILRAQNW